jgi:hypothetical protein
MKKTVQILLAGIFVCFTGCKFEEENIFDDSSANRIEKAKIEYAELLCSSPNGWVMEYFPTDDQTGYTFLMKFLENGEVKMLSKNALTGNKLTRDSCLFEFTSISGPVLTFNSYSENNTFHQLSTPEDIPDTEGSEQGYGYEGDYEFAVMKTETNHILLKGLKRKVYIPLTRLPEERNWDDYFNLLDEMNTTLFGANTPQLRLTVKDSLFTLTGGASHIFKIVPEGGDPITDGIDRSFIITDYGIRFAKPFETNDLSVQTFQLSEDKSYLYEVENQDIRISSPIYPFSFFLNEDNWTQGIEWTIDSLTLGGAFQTAYAKVIDGCKTVYKEDFGRFFFKYKSDRRSKTFSFKSGTAKVYEGTFDFDILQNPGKEGEVIFVDKGTADNNGKLYKSKIDGFGEILDLITSGSFTLTTDKPLSMSVLKFTSVSNPDNWFALSLNY